MEYMAVLKRPGVDFLNTAEKGAINFELGQKSWKARLAGRRLCSQALFIVVMLFLMFVMFASQLIVHVQLQQLRDQNRMNEDKINDMLEGALLQKQQMDHRIARLEHEQRNNRRRRRHHESPTYAVVRGGGFNRTTGVFKWTTTTNDRTWISPNMLGLSSREKLGAPLSGLYSIKIQITVKGRTDDDPVFRPVGMWICEEIKFNNGTTYTTILDRVYITQDDGGEIRQVRGGQAEDAPVDMLTYTNVVYLQQRHKIFVKIPTEHRNDHTIQYDNSADSAHFSMHLVYAN